MNKSALSLAAAAAGSAALLTAPLAAADDEPADPAAAWVGQPATLVTGDVVQTWTISDLKPSSAVIPHRTVGTLWEATATDQAIAGTVIPMVSNLNARSTIDGQTYRVLWGVATPQGVNPATLAQGQMTKGTVYFDVTGAPPDVVTYNDGHADLLVWVTPPAPTGATVASSPLQPSGVTPTPAASPVEGAEAAPATSVGTPVEGAEPAPAPGAPVEGAEAPPATSVGSPVEGAEPAPPATTGGVPAEGVEPAPPATTGGVPAEGAAAGAPATSVGSPVVGIEGQPTGQPPVIPPVVPASG